MSAAIVKRPTLVALIHGMDQPGLVARTAGWIFERGGNIVHVDEHCDREVGVFQRIEWEPALVTTNGVSAIATAEDAAQEEKAFLAFAASLGMIARLSSSYDRPRIALFVSKSDHCFHDLVLRGLTGEFAGDFVVVVSNHADLGPAARSYGLPFHHIPVTAANKPEAEAQHLALLRHLGIKLVVLARYMQVLSAEFIDAFAEPVINIHPSFLPAFTGGRPYHQAHLRGVKLIGATAHYVTKDLDQGPIIHQDVARVTHRHSVEDLIRKGRDVEKAVLAQAVRWHLESRVLAYRGKAVVFD
jgi:formyltetrahydrofolate deformylase